MSPSGLSNLIPETETHAKKHIQNSSKRSLSIKLTGFELNCSQKKKLKKKPAQIETTPHLQAITVAWGN